MKFTMRKRLVFLVYVVINLSYSYCSIRFDQVEYEDPNVLLDKSNSNGLSCSHLFEDCRITAECCGVATCVLPAWSKTPVCLVPGYKHDKRFKEISSISSLRPQDIRYIRDSYNTSKYDFLLSDLTFSAPPMEDETHSLNTKSENATVSNYSSDRLNNNSLEGQYFTSENFNCNNESVAQSTMDNSTNFNSSDGLENFLNDSLPYQPTRVVQNELLYPKSNANNSDSSYEPYLSLNKRLSFLLINSTIGQSGQKPDIAGIYDQMTNSDRFKTVVELLKKQMKLINDRENNLKLNENQISEIENFESTAMPPTTAKISKWDIIRKLFISKHGAYKIAGDQNHAQNYNGVESKSAESFDKIEDFGPGLDKVTFENQEPIKSNGAEDDAFEFYNIDIPYDLNQETDKIAQTFTYEPVFKELGRALESISPTLRPTDLLKNSLENKNEDMINVLTSKFKEPVLEATTNISDGVLKKTHFWEKIHFWHFHSNVSAKLAKDFKSWFVRKIKTNITKKQVNQSMPLNEFFFLTLKKNFTATTTTSVQKEKSPEFANSNFLASASSLSDSDELRLETGNDSYVFVMEKDDLVEPEKISRWKTVLNLFHKTKVIPSNEICNIAKIDGETSQNLSLVNCSETPIVHDVIRLPEHFMPEVLESEGRQINVTDWDFEDSMELKYSTIEEHNSSNSHFFFFFK